jgi:cysteine sulfinate desulfinase/cysteine desulfurase-like protein
MISSRVKEAYVKAEAFEKAFDLLDRKVVRKHIKKAKESIMDLIGAKKGDHLLFYPSKNEALLRAIYEVLMPRAQRSGRTVILIPKTEKGEIRNLLKTAGRLGLSFREVEVDERGKITKEALELAICPRTLAVFLSWADPLTAAIAPIFEIASLCAEKELFLLVDGTDTVGKVFFRFQDMNIDLLLFTHENITAAATKKGGMEEADYSLKEFFALAAFAEESVETMDLFPMEYAVIKSDVIDRIENSSLLCTFLNKGSGYLFDRWCFAFKGVPSENLAYFLREKGIFVERASDEAVTLTFSLMTSKEHIFSTWDQIITVAKMIKEFSYE